MCSADIFLGVLAILFPPLPGKSSQQSIFPLFTNSFPSLLTRPR